MEFIFSRLSGCLGQDGAAYASWTIASVIWVLGFLYVSQNNIDSCASSLSRGLMLFLFNLPVNLRTDYSKIPPSSIKYMLYRHGLLVVYGFVFAQCFFYLPINVVHTVSSSGPLFVLLIDFFLFKIQISKQQIVGVFLSSVGMLLAVNGQLLEQIINRDYSFTSNFQNYKAESLNPYFQILVCVVLIITEVGWAYSIVLVKKVRNATHYQLNFQYGFLLTMFAGCLYAHTSVPQQIRLDSFLRSLVFQGLPLAFGQAFFSHSMTITKNYGVMTMTGFISVAMGYVIKLWRYEQPLSWICLAGSLLVMWGVSKIVLKQQVQ